MGKWIRDVVVGFALLTPSVVGAQSSDGWREHFAAGEEARRAGEVEAYADAMAAAALALPEGLLNRPFVQYHAARSAALAGRSEEAVRWLRVAWEEGIESLMISFAAYDPAFESLADQPGFRAVLAAPAEMTLEVLRLRGDVHLLRGAGSNLVAQVGPDGVLLVDTGYAPALPALRRALASLGGDRVDRLVVTHPHEDHMGATPELGAEATVLAHPATRDAMEEAYVFMEGVELPPKAAPARPDVLVVGDTTFAFNGERVRIVPTIAHTAGDLTVYFEGARVAHLGDAYLAGNPMMYPGQDDPDGFLDRLEGLLDGMDPGTLVVSGHDEVATLADVRRQIAETRACMALVREAVVAEDTLEEAIERVGDRFPPQWVSFFFRLFTAG